MTDQEFQTNKERIEIATRAQREMEQIDRMIALITSKDSQDKYVGRNIAVHHDAEYPDGRIEVNPSDSGQLNIQTFWEDDEFTTNFRAFLVGELKRKRRRFEKQFEEA